MAEQLENLDASCDGFDAGRRAEAKRLAVSVRVICHQTPNSTSLLRHLGVDDMIKMIDSVPAEHYRVQRLGGFLVGGGLAFIRAQVDGGSATSVE